MKLRSTLALLLFQLLASCAGPPPDLSKICVGMSKSEVVSRLGKPDSVSASGSIENIVYGKWDDSPVDGRIGGGRYFVQFDKGLVRGYGAVEVPESVRLSQDIRAARMLQGIANSQAQQNQVMQNQVQRLAMPRTRTFDVQNAGENRLKIRETTSYYGY
jgi:hypothetical protein